MNKFQITEWIELITDKDDQWMNVVSEVSNWCSKNELPHSN